ncbi:hypothetical protein BgiMline_029898 [Biomphalaria glabrata]|nr:hypothetical protein BgiBS90_003952 [Biomphalaria glabrata]
MADGMREHVDKQVQQDRAATINQYDRTTIQTGRNTNATCGTLYANEKASFLHLKENKSVPNVPFRSQKLRAKVKNCLMYKSKHLQAVHQMCTTMDGDE